MSKSQIKTWQEAYVAKDELIQSIYKLFDAEFKELGEESSKLANPKLTKELGKLRRQAIAAHSNIKTINKKILRIVENILIEQIFEKNSIKP